jgi:ATP synthase protein I
MPKAHHPREEAMKRLEAQADALEAKATRHVPEYGSKAMAGGARLVAGLVGGPLAGLGFGAGFDFLAHTAPWGLIAGILIGFVASVVLAVRSAQAMSAAAKTEGWPMGEPLPYDDEDEDEQ